MFGAIFFQEMLIAGRRQRSFFLRWVWAAILLVQLAPRLIAGIIYEHERPGSSAMGVFVQFFDSFTAQHFFWLLVLTPALTAGAIADEKMRGTLDYLLTTCLNPAEIVLGKLCARGIQAFMVTLVALPLLAFFGAIADFDLEYLITLFIASTVLIAGTGCLSMLASVWCRRTRDAVLCTYLALFAGFCVMRGADAAGWDTPANVGSPWRLACHERDGRWGRLALFTLAWLVPAAGGVALASWRLRRAATAPIAQTVRPGWIRRRERIIPEHANPILWRERCVQGVAPLARLRAIPVWLAAPLFAVACAAGFAVPVLVLLPPGVDLWGAFTDDGIFGLHEAFRMNDVRGWNVAAVHGGIALFVSTLLVAVRSSGAFTEERERSTWDAVMLTPLSTRQIVRGKYWGLHAAWAPYLVAYAVGTVPIAALVSVQALVIAVLSVGTMVVYAPWIAAVGLVFSAYLHSSWRSLLATLGACYAYYLFVTPFLFIPSCMIASIVSAFVLIAMIGIQGRPPGPGNRGDDLFLLIMMLAHGGTLLFLNAAIIWPISWVLLRRAHGRLDKAERAKVSYNEQQYMQMLPRLDRLAEELAEERSGVTDQGSEVGGGS